MTEAVLVPILFCICSNIVGTKEDKIECFERYTNCTVSAKGIVTKDDLIKKCNFVTGAEKCLK